MDKPEQKKKVREQPIFTTKAHVFQIDPNTKKKWLPASTQAIHVSYYYDSTRNTYRIISVEGSKAVINSTITPNMTFTKTSQKFGQWSDTRANTVYGLGFASEGELTKFVDKFKEVKELTRQAKQQAPQSNGTDSNNHVSEGSSSPALLAKPSSVSSSQSESPNTTPVHERQSSLPTSVEQQLKYENDRLKIALAQSSANAKKWEVELQTLKNNNARLTTALQESTANVEEWKKQLAAYKEESNKLKKRVMDLEGSGGGSEAMQRQVTDMTERLQDLEKANQLKAEEITDLNRSMEALKPFQSQSAKLQDRVQLLEKENEILKSRQGELQRELETTRDRQLKQKQVIGSLKDNIGTKLSELYEIHDKLSSSLQSDS